ncbi:MAG: hypothetical protein AAGK47_10090 [Bacteroidota bacterium]
MKKEETASFVVRFNQKIFANQSGSPQVQWRGSIRHVQTGEEKRFAKFEVVTQFIQDKLQEMAIEAIKDKSPEEQKGILAQSFNIWKKVAEVTPKAIIDTIKDPKKQLAEFQHQLSNINENINLRVEEVIEQRKAELDDWRMTSKSDYKNIMERLDAVTAELAALHQKVDRLR